MRAFDRKSQEFRDFVITRIEEPVVLSDDAVADHEKASKTSNGHGSWSFSWCPPDQPHPYITEMDYGMKRELEMRVRAATAGYMLRKWSVDCSPDHSLRGKEFRLWLKNHLTLYGVGDVQYFRTRLFGTAR